MARRFRSKATFLTRVNKQLNSSAFWTIILGTFAVAVFFKSHSILGGNNELPLLLPKGEMENKRIITAKNFPNVCNFFFRSEEKKQDILPGAIVQTVGSKCGSKNALVFLAQKKHSTYGRDSLGLLIKTLDLFRDNYLSIGNNRDNVDIFLFHTGDFGDADLLFLEARLNLGVAENNDKLRAILRLVNLNNTAYWSLPELFKHDNQAMWKGSEIYPLGYRHMCRFFGMQLWHFFRDLNENGGCRYRYIARLDEDSFILSPIQYDMFELMAKNQYVYGYRICAYELEDMKFSRMWYRKWRKSMQGHMQRNITKDLCGFYTNFFVADLQFFLSPGVTSLLEDIDQHGFYYRKRFGDLLVHTLAVYAFAAPSRIHRFLDFTYEHATVDHFKDAEKQCISWGAIQAGYNDPNGEKTVEDFYETHVLKKDCFTANMTHIAEEDLSPSYSHIPSSVRHKHPKISLKTVHAGLVELPKKGLSSG